MTLTTTTITHMVTMARMISTVLCKTVTIPAARRMLMTPAVLPMTS